jgi:hypothetical protein
MFISVKKEMDLIETLKLFDAFHHTLRIGVIISTIETAIHKVVTKALVNCQGSSFFEYQNFTWRTPSGRVWIAELFYLFVQVYRVACEIYVALESSMAVSGRI